MRNRMVVVYFCELRFWAWHVRAIKSTDFQIKYKSTIELQMHNLAILPAIWQIDDSRRAHCRLFFCRQ